MDHAQGLVTVLVGFHQHPESIEVVYLPQLFALGSILLDLEIGAVDALGAPDYLSFEVVLPQSLAQHLGHPLHILFPFLTPSGDQAGDLLVFFGVQVAESQIVQTPFDLPNPQPVSQGRVDIQGFLSDTPPLFRGQGVQGPHVVQPVGQLDQHHADVLGHGHQHLTEAFSVNGVLVVGGTLGIPGGFAELGVYPGQLGHTVDQGADLLPVPGPDFFQGNAAVFYDIMKQGRDDGVGIQVQVG